MIDLKVKAYFIYFRYSHISYPFIFFHRSSLSSIKVRGLSFDNVLSCWLDPLKTVKKCKKRLADRCTGLYCHNECPATLHPLSGLVVKIPPRPIDPSKFGISDRAKFYLELLNGLSTLNSQKTQKFRQTER